MSKTPNPSLIPDLETAIPLEFIINRTILQDEMIKSEKISLGFTQLAIIKKMEEYLGKKFPLSAPELRRLLKIGLHEYQQHNETPLEKLSALQNEDRYEAFVKLKKFFQQVFERILLKKDAMVISYISSNLDGFFGLYIPDFST